MQLILIRHGETLWNKEGRIQGVSDVELSDAGVEQARRLALSLKDQDIGAIHASPLKRAYRTAEIINSFHGRVIEVHSGLMEMDQGDFEGLSFKELIACEKDFLKRWVADPASVKMPRGESLAELQKRAWQPMEKIIAASQNALVVAHNFTIAAILCRLRNISLSEFRSTCVDNASKTLIRFKDGQAHIETINDRSHLIEPAIEKGDDGS
ncbi:MAG: histidine phosphatase family protein [Deltaproteobacteria bacterium]